MPYGEPDPSDPHVLVGVVLPGSAESVRDMAWVFAEELARLGLSERAILAVFHSPFYAGAHRALQVLGEEEIAVIVGECTRVFGRPRRGGAARGGA